MATRRDCRDASPRERRPPAVLPGSPPPVLILSHFCPKPFLCFGDVRPGASRTLPLALLNPNAEAAAVTLPRGPAAACGFHVWPRAFELQPKEKMVISVNWTPVKEGRVREILTFLVNDILKHEVILLGNAEEPKRKKRSLWDAINKKKALPSTSHKRISNIQNVNKTFSVSQKVDRIRSPLQACENLGRSEGCSPTENNYLILEENKIPISPISPMSTGCCGETRPPHCVHQPTTSSPPRVPENGELWHLEGASVSSDFSEKVVPDTSVNSVNSISGHIEEDSKLIFTPNCSSTLNITQNQGNFLSPDSFVKNSQAANNEPELVSRISSDTFLKDNSMPVYLESKAVHEIYQTILSPDSFIKDNYGLNQALDSKLVNSTLSPNQFVKDNMTYISISQHTCKLSPLSKEISQVSQSPQRKNEVLPCVPECQGSNSPKAFFEDPKASDMKPNCYSFTKQNQPKFSAVQDISGYRHNSPPKRRPILSATVTKLNPSGTRENRTKACEPKARRCLHSVAGRCENITDNLEEKESLPLPIIDPVESRSYSCRTVTMPSSKTTFMARKRKSEGNREDASVIITVTEPTEVQEIKGIHFFPAELKTSTAKKTKKVVTPISKRISDREKRDPKKKTDSLAYKTPNAKTNKRTKRIVPVAQSNLTFIKPLKTDIPRHPMPFAAKNMFYDERWKEKQEQGFTWWLNFVLTPDDFTVRAGVSEVNAASLLLGAEGQYKVSVPRAPTKDEASLRAYTARCRLNRLRRAACRLFTSERMVKATKKLEIEIEARRLVVRKDRHLWKDVGERQKVLNWLLSYHPLWLRIGLETVYGELLALEDNSDVTGMAVFILSRLLWNPDVAAEYRHPSVPHLYRDGHEEALSKFTLKKLLLLVCFLDYAKASRLIDHDPCLFCKDAEFKTSKEILLAFSRDFLSGEGDLSRHLSLLGFPVTHAQTPLDEFDFAVTNLAVDLHCGVRLVRTMELLTRNWDLSKKLRIPAISRLQKLHNVDIVLQILKSRGIALTDEHGSAILSKDIVDRHREKTLALLWKIVLAFQVDISLNLDQLKEEIHFLKHTWRTRKATRALSGHPDAVLRRKADVRPSGPSEPQSGSVTLLMEWVNAVCAFYNKTVENFTVSFSDGRVLCYLIHHYHPSYVPLGAICQRTTQTVECAQTGSVVLNSSTESDESFLDVSLKALSHENTSELHKELLENERKNFQLVRSAVRDLGGIPAMIHHSDMSNTIPDEKVVITYLSFLCARLLDLRREARAALLIQTTWRKYKLKVDLRHHQERDKAARIIQSAIINFLMKRRLKKICAALVIQKYWRRRLQQRNLLVLEKENLEKIQSKAASVIQRYWRSYSTRKEFLKLKKCSIALQSRIRRLIAVASYKRYLWAAITIQRHWRARMSRKRDLQSSKLLQSSRVRIQPVFRQWRPHKMQLWREAAETPQRAFGEQPRALEAGSATLIQAWYRMHRALQKYTHIRACVVLIQARFRGVQARKAYRQKREAVLTLQRRWRAWLQGRRRHSHYLRTRAAALRLQAAFRARRAQRAGAARVLQAYWRMRRERFRFLSLRKTVIKLQAHVRGHQQLRKYRKTKEATLVIQIHFRAYLAAKAARAAYWEVRTAVVVVQAMWRGRRARERLHRARTSIIRIQSCYRAYINRKRFLSLKHATVKLQSVVRMKRTREYYLRLRAAALFTQRRYRSLRMAAIARGEYRCLRGSCVRLQALVRGYLVRKQLSLRRGAAVALQAHFKMRKVRQDYLKMREAALVIQGAYRAHRVRVRRAATCLQAAYRGHRARRLLQQQRSAALTLQAAFRGLCQRRKYRSVLRSMVRIQRWYRALRAARGLRMQFLKTRAAILSLQAAYRGWQVREQVRRERRAAVTLQSAVRMAQARRQFLLLKTAALVIQRRRRALAAGRKQRVAYVELRLAALTLQSAWKRRAARRQAAAVVIQSYCRMYVQRERWRVVRKAACLIQRYYRAYSLGRKQQLLYRKTKAAVVTLQAAYRRMRVRRTAQERSRAAVTIQSSFRAHRARKRYAALRAAAVAIQRWYRSVKIADCQRKEYLALKKAAAKIQAVRRGLRARRHIQHMHKAATLIKAVFKMHQSKMRYRKMRAAAVIIQVRFRAYRRGKTQRAQYLAILEAVTVLQASFRGARVRQALRAMWTAATQIQSCYRGHRERARFRELRKATETVQRRFRAVRARDVHVQRYRRLRCAAVRIQAVFRGVRARRHVQAMHSAATAIQRWFRAHTLRRRFLCLRKTVVWVQRKYRANICAKHHLEFLQLQKAVIRIQSSFRSWVVRKRLQAMHRAATVIQATFRMHRARVRYRALKHASVFIQHGSMTQRALQLQREDFMGQRCPAATVQAARQGRRAGPLLRGRHRAAAGARSARGTFRPSFLHRKAWWATKGVQGKHRANKKKALQHRAGANAAACAQDMAAAEQRQEQRQAATSVQKHFKAFGTRKRFLHFRNTVVLAQRRSRALAAMRTHAACLQSSSTGVKVRRHLAATREILSFYGSCRARAHYHAETPAAGVAQKHCRSGVRAAMEKGQPLAVRESVQTAQAASRGRKVGPESETASREEMAVLADRPASLCASPRTPHRAARGSALRPRQGSHPLVAAVSQAQSQTAEATPEAFQKMTPRKEAQEDAALRVRASLLMAAWQRRRVEQRRAAVTLQLSFWCRRVRRQLLLLRGPALLAHGRHRAPRGRVSLRVRRIVVLIQARVRGFLQRRRFQKIKDSALKIQAVWRGYRVRKYVREVKAACKIQAWYRCQKARRECPATPRAVSATQGHCRTTLERAWFLKVKASTVIIQRKWRATVSGRRAREDFLTMKISEQRAKTRLLRFTAAAYCHLSALRIQRAYKRHVAVKTAEKHVGSVICIQRWFRRRLQLKRLVRVCHGVMSIRREARERRTQQGRAASVIQRAVRRFLLRKKRERLNNGAIKIQAWWRGCSWRRKNDCMKIKAIRTSLQIINGEVREENKLYRRTARALHHLLTYKHLSAILEALRHLEVVTRLSPLCCENMAESGAIPTILVLIRSCNRSVPCMEVISCAVQVLLNVAKYEKTAPAVYGADSCVHTLLELLQMYREKPGDRVADKSRSIFTRTCCLLAVLLRATSLASDVWDRSKVVDCVCSIYKLTARKHRLNADRTLHQHRSCAAVPSIPEAPVRPRPAARLKPDWALRRDSMGEIANPLQALQMVMDTLGTPS